MSSRVSPPSGFFEKSELKRKEIRQILIVTIKIVFLRRSHMFRHKDPEL
jgi:hypothetical protein